MKQPKRILFFKFGALGDVLMTTPLLRQTRRSFPAAQIDYLVGKNYEGALQNNPFLDEIQTFDPAIFTGKKLSALWQLSRTLRSYDHIFVLDKHWSFAAAAWCAGIPSRSGFARDWVARGLLTHAVPYGPVRHEIHYYLDLLVPFATVDRDDVKMDFLALSIHANLPNLPADYVVCINSGGKNLREQTAIRMLPVPLFQNLIALLAGRYAIVLLGNDEDHTFYASLDLPSGTRNFAGKLDLPASVEVMRRARHIYTTDNGAMHLAGTTDTPLTIFFGPTHPARKAPLRPGVHSIWTDEAIYNDAYEVKGDHPRGKKYFQTLIGGPLADSFLKTPPVFTKTTDSSF